MDSSFAIQRFCSKEFSRSMLMEETGFMKRKEPVVVNISDRWSSDELGEMIEKWGSLKGWIDGPLGNAVVEGVGHVLVTSERGVEEEKELRISQPLRDYMADFPRWRSTSATDGPERIVCGRRRRIQHLETRDDESTAVYTEIPYVSDFTFWKYPGGYELIKDIFTPMPDFLEDWPRKLHLDLSQSHYRAPTPPTKISRWVPAILGRPSGEDGRIHVPLPFAYLFIGPKGGMSAAHTDDHSTHGWLLQLVGRKRFTMWPVGEIRETYSPFHVDLEPFDMLYVPMQWKHEVVALSDCVSLQWRHLCHQCKTPPTM